MIKNEYETSSGIDSVTPMYFGVAIAAAVLSGILGIISLGSAPKHLFIKPDTSMLGGAGSNAIVTNWSQSDPTSSLFKYSHSSNKKSHDAYHHMNDAGFKWTF